MHDSVAPQRCFTTAGIFKLSEQPMQVKVTILDLGYQEVARFFRAEEATWQQ